MVYPRVCGGTTSAAVLSSAASGLSPRVRGNRERGDGSTDPRRSIPACAGEPARLNGQRKETKVYPRVCGGTLPAIRRRCASRGLSPRVRGNLTERIYADMEYRSIPACAGEPRKPHMPQAPLAVYPRVCGGTHPSLRSTRSLNGLSPRVRGNLSRALDNLPCIRSIPACAGEP